MTALSVEEIVLTVQGGGEMPAALVRPRGTATAGVLLFQDAYGVNDQLRDIGARFAGLGCLAILPELFHRTGHGIVAAFDDSRNPLRVRAKDALTLDGLAADAEAAYRHLVQAEGLAPNRIVAVGFCMGGRVAFLANARLPLAASISFYGGGIAPDLLALAAQQRGRLLMIWGGNDSHIAAADRRAVEDALAHAGKSNVQVVFSQAKHAFFAERHPDHDPLAASAAWALVVAFLEGLVKR